MKVILRSNVEGVGNTGDVVEVANGYAQNFLMPKGLAMRATEGAVSQAADMKRSRDLQDLKQREVAEEAAQRLEAATTARLSERQTRSRSPRAGRVGGGDRGARPMAAGGGGWGGIMADVPVFEVELRRLRLGDRRDRRRAAAHCGSWVHLITAE